MKSNTVNEKPLKTASSTKSVTVHLKSPNRFTSTPKKCNKNEETIVIARPSSTYNRYASVSYTTKTWHSNYFCQISYRQTTVNILSRLDLIFCQKYTIVLAKCSYLFPQLVFMFCYSFFQLWNFSLLLLDNAPQVFNTVMIGQLIFGHFKPARVRKTEY